MDRKKILYLLVSGTILFCAFLSSYITTKGNSFGNLTTGELTTGTETDIELAYRWLDITTGSEPQGRAAHSAVWDSFNKQMIVFGGTHDVIPGVSSPEDLKDVWTYDPTSKKWFSGSDAPTARREHAAVWDTQNNQMIVYGGANRSTDVRFKDTWTYNPATKSWTRKADGPTGRSWAPAVWDPIHNQMIVFGGYPGFSDTWAYIPSDDTWVKKADHPTVRWSHMAVWNNKDGVVIVFGGVSTHTHLSDTWIYDPKRNDWTRKADMPFPVWSASSVYDPVHNRVIVFGGQSEKDNKDVNLNTTLIYDPAVDNWTVFDLKSQPPARAWIDRVQVWDSSNNQMIIYGGSGVSAFLADLWTLKTTPAYLGRVVGLEWDWQKTENLPAPRTEPEAVVYNGVIYVVGGADSSSIANTVFYGKINYDGSVQVWTSTTPIPAPRKHPGLIAHNGRLYVISGELPGDQPLVGDVFFAAINPDGSLGTWVKTTSLPRYTSDHAFTVLNNKIYVIGGRGPSTIFYKEVYFADINPDGTLGNWRNTTPLPSSRAGARAVALNNRIYVVGGHSEETGYVATNTVFYTSVDSDGNLGNWSTASPLPFITMRHTALVLEDHIFVFGGHQGGTGQATVLNTTCGAKVNVDGSLENWYSYGPLFDEICQHASVTWQGYVYVVGGFSANGSPRDTVYVSRLTWRSLTACERADVNCDGTVNIVDIANVARHFGHRPEECPNDP